MDDQAVIPTSAQYHDFCHHVAPLVREAGAIIKAAFYNNDSPPDPATKDNNAIDLVTVTDRAIEALIKSRIAQLFPMYLFIGEESTSESPAHSSALSDLPTVICDPIDGTTNFVHGFPFICTSIGLVVNKIPTVAVVYNPILDEMYISHRGFGAFMNGMPLPLHRVHHPMSLQSTLFITEGGNNRSASVMRHKLDSWNSILSADLGNLRGIRCTGSGALDLCMIARGAADVYWEIGLHAWDMAAGVLLIQEAGGLVVGQEYLGLSASGRSTPDLSIPFDIMGRKALALRKADVRYLLDISKFVNDYPCERD